MHTKSSYLNTVTACNVLDQRSLSDNLQQSFSGVSLLVQRTNITRCHLLLQGNVDGMVDALEPHGNMRDKSNINTQLGRNFFLVNMVSQTVRDEIVGQVLDVILGTRLGASA